MRQFAGSLPLLAMLGVACFFQDSGPGAIGEASSNAPTGGATGDTTGSATTDGGSATTDGGSASTDAETGASTNPPCDAYYWSDFTADPGSGWTIFSPSWLWDPAGGLFQGKVADQIGAGAQLEAGVWQDFTLHVRLRLGPTSYGGVVLGAADQFVGDFLYIQLDSTDGDIEGFRANTMDPDFQFIGLVTANVWEELVVRFQGTDLTLTLNGETIAGLQVQSLGEGMIGLIVLEGAMDVDVIAVCPP